MFKKITGKNLYDSIILAYHYSLRSLIVNDLLKKFGSKYEEEKDDEKCDFSDSKIFKNFVRDYKNDKNLMFYDVETELSKDLPWNIEFMIAQYLKPQKIQLNSTDFNSDDAEQLIPHAAIVQSIKTELTELIEQKLEVHPTVLECQLFRGTLFWKFRHEEKPSKETYEKCLVETIKEFGINNYVGIITRFFLGIKHELRERFPEFELNLNRDKGSLESELDTFYSMSALNEEISRGLIYNKETNFFKELIKKQYFRK